MSPKQALGLLGVTTIMRRICLFGSFCLLILTGCHPKDKQPQLIIYAAASLTDVISEVGEAFAQQNQIELQYNFASSGTLARQLTAHTPADLYLSANTQWMDAVNDAHLLAPDSRSSLLRNRLVIVTHKDATFTLTKPNTLGQIAFTFCTIGDPAHVPVGQYAQQWLESIDQWQNLQGRISPAPDARSVLAQVSHRKDLIGIVYYSDYLTQKETLRVLYEVPEATGPVIEYQVARLRNAPNAPLASEFIKYMRSELAASTFEAVGFSIIDSNKD